MGFYDAFKGVLNMTQKVDSTDLYRQSLNLSAQTLEVQGEIIKLKAESKELKSQKDIGNNIEYHVDPFIIRKSNKKPIKYCAACWADEKKLLPLQNFGGNNYRCPFCKFKIVDTSN